MSPVAVARRTDPETSHDAARSVADLTEKQAAVFDVLHAFGPMTDEQLVREYGESSLCAPDMFPTQSESGLRTRRCELTRRGLVTAAVSAGRTRSGRRCIVWQVVR